MKLRRKAPFEGGGATDGAMDMPMAAYSALPCVAMMEYEPAGVLAPPVS
jgi:hypothetical protein